MAVKIASPELKEFFAQEVMHDPNATLAIARLRLARLCDAAPGESVSMQHEWLSEVEELIAVHTEHCPLTDFIE
jgi:hypothetical protein